MEMTSLRICSGATSYSRHMRWTMASTAGVDTAAVVMAAPSTIRGQDAGGQEGARNQLAGLRRRCQLDQPPVVEPEQHRDRGGPESLGALGRDPGDGALREAHREDVDLAEPAAAHEQ